MGGYSCFHNWTPWELVMGKYPYSVRYCRNCGARRTQSYQGLVRHDR